jgi:dienelactone hydrolase
MTTPAPDVLTGWVPSPFAAAGATHDVYRKGTGPGVVLLPEAPGATPEVLRLGDHLADDGFAVAVPSLFGTPGRPVSIGYAVGSMTRICVSREFAAFARRADRPVAEYVRALARALHAEVGGPGVGVIGMCFTGGFALAAAVEPSVLAPVASQPSVPFPLGSRKTDLGMSDREAEAVVRRVRDEGLCAMGLRFSDDRVSPRQRFDRLADLLGDGFRVIEIDSSPGNPHGVGRQEHSVLTSHDVGTPGHPVTAAREEVVAFLHERLKAG